MLREICWERFRVTRWERLKAIVRATPMAAHWDFFLGLAEGNTLGHALCYVLAEVESDAL